MTIMIMTVYSLERLELMVQKMGRAWDNDLE